MKIFTDLADVVVDATVVTIGNFDGVHLGHRALLARTHELASEFDVVPAVLTFWPHPQEVLTGRRPPLLGTLEQRLAWIEALEIELTVVQTFDRDFAALAPEAFLDAVVERLQPAALVLGHDFRFGDRGRGDTELARAYGVAHGFVVEEVEPVRIDDHVVSSTLIRSLLADGDVGRAARFLGRPWQIWGEVTSGAGRGRTLGFPTVNIATDNDLVVADGVYGGVARLADGTRYVAAISVGTNPTFGEEPRHAEAFLLDYPGEEVRGEIRLAFLDYLRAQAVYRDPARLIAQIEADVATIRRLAERGRWLERGEP